MAIIGKNKHYHWKTIKYSHWIEAGKRNGLTEKIVKDTIDEIVNTLPAVIDSISKTIPKYFPEKISTSIFDGMKEAVKILL